MSFTLMVAGLSTTSKILVAASTPSMNFSTQAIDEWKYQGYYF